MVLGNKRGPRRSSSSTASTVSTIVFIVLCVLGVWLLSSKSFAPPQKTTSTATDDTNAKTFSNDDRKDQTVFEDNPGLLPNDAIQSDDQNGRERDEEAKPDEDQRKKIIKNIAKGEEDKQEQGQTQISEESALTLNQQQEQSMANHGDEKETQSTEEMMKQQQQEDAGNGNQTVNSQDLHNQLSDEDNKRRMKKHQDQHEQQKQETPKNFTTFNDTTNPVKEKPNDNLQTRQQTTEESQRTKEQKPTNSNSGDAHHGIPQESSESKKSWSTQAVQSETQKERRTDEHNSNHTWLLCNETAGPDFIPCLDNEKAIKQLRSTIHYEHRERHCPEKGPTCLVPIPQGYKRSIDWPASRDKVRLNKSLRSA